MRIVGNVAHLHCDLLVGLEEKRDRDGKEEVIEGEDENQGPGVVEGHVDGIVLRSVAITKCEANGRKNGTRQGTSLLDVGA